MKIVSYTSVITTTTTPQQICAENADRVGLILQNKAACSVYLKYRSAMTPILNGEPQDAIEIEPNATFIDDINCCTDSIFLMSDTTAQIVIVEKSVQA